MIRLKTVFVTKSVGMQVPACFCYQELVIPGGENHSYHQNVRTIVQNDRIQL